MDLVRIHSEEDIVSKGSVVSLSMELMAKLMTKTAWGELVNILPELIKDIDRVAKEFIKFLKNGGRVIIELKHLALGTTIDPAEFIGGGFTVWKGPKEGEGLQGDEDRDEREDDLTEVDFTQVDFATCLNSGERSIKGEEKLERMKASGKLRLGGRTFLALWQNYQATKEESVLEWLYRIFGIVWIDFFGLVLRDPNGRRYVLCLCRSDNGHWSWDCRSLDLDRYTISWSASLARNSLAIN